MSPSLDAEIIEHATIFVGRISPTFNMSQQGSVRITALKSPLLANGQLDILENTANSYAQISSPLRTEVQAFGMNA